ncbi:alpha/beta hydrolase [Pseudonocardia spinosispora]|uniref:alpha/beta hydrolase n=1 Tax=Pseudonocardia spinosispora TaxID=103441 RepID=UPI000400DFCB|nr:alpha/beta hydrolase [Pseudonocardia spinosispora]
MRLLALLSALLVSAFVVPSAATPAASASVPIRPRWASQRILELDRTGSGEVVVALGDPGTAHHVAVIVPGVGINLTTFDDPENPARRPYGMALSLSHVAPDTAVIAWLGYRPPEGVGLAAATGARAREGATALRRFMGQVRRQARPDANIALVCHSYGTVACGDAAPGLPVDDLMLLGSPGARVPSAAALRIPGQVWAATAATDWIRWVPHVRIGDLGHGPDPSARAFGARALPTTGVSGHDGYFAGNSSTLTAIAAVITRRVGNLSTPSPVSRHT